MLVVGSEVTPVVGLRTLVCGVMSVPGLRCAATPGVKPVVLPDTMLGVLVRLTMADFSFSAGSNVGTAAGNSSARFVVPGLVRVGWVVNGSGLFPCAGTSVDEEAPLVESVAAEGFFLSGRSAGAPPDKPEVVLKDGTLVGVMTGVELS